MIHTFVRIGERRGLGGPQQNNPTEHTAPPPAVCGVLTGDLVRSLLPWTRACLLVLCRSSRRCVCFRAQDNENILRRYGATRPRRAPPCRRHLAPAHCMSPCGRRPNSNSTSLHSSGNGHAGLPHFFPISSNILSACAHSCHLLSISLAWSTHELLSLFLFSLALLFM